MKLRTYHYRIKDSTSSKHLIRMSHSVNYVWNYCNEVNQERWKKFRKTFSAYELNNLTKGCAKELGVHAQSVQAVCEHYVQACKLSRKVKLKWRSKEHSLGWIPFKLTNIKVSNNTIIYLGQTFKLWKTQDIEGIIKVGSFCQDSSGHWFVNLAVEEADCGRIKTGKECGIDLGLKTLVTLSDGTAFTRENITKQYEIKLAKAQRARKKKRVKALHTKIKNKRKDWNHKTSTYLVQKYDKIVVGNVSSSKLKKTNMSKSVSDASWYNLKQMLAYKAIRLGVEYKEVNESYSTITCSNCSVKSGPKGLSALGVREWVCSLCGSVHDRDINAAKNILRIGYDTPIKEI